MKSTKYYYILQSACLDPEEYKGLRKLDYIIQNTIMSIKKVLFSQDFSS